MNIVVPIKLVPDLAEELEINADGTDLDRDLLSYRINEFCDHALEEALLLKEAHGGTVTVLALERDETDKVLFTALAKGATKAIKVTGLEDGAPTRAAAKAFCQVLGNLDYDLVMTGVQAADDRDGQLGVLMASYLGIPHVSVVSAVEWKGGKLVIHKEYAGGVMGRFEVAPKVVLGIQAAKQPPRYAPVSRVRQIMQEAKIEERAADGIDVSCGSTVRRMFTPERGEGAQMLTGSADDVAKQIVAILKKEQLIMGKDILIVAEHKKGVIDDITFELIGKGRELAKAKGGALTVALFGGGAAAASKLGKADKVFVVEHPLLADFNPEAHTTALVEVFERTAPSLVLVGNTSMGMDLAAALSARKDIPLVAYAIDVALDGGKVVATSQLYAGKVSIESVIDGEVGVVSVLAGSFPADAGRGEGSPAVETLPAPAALAQTRLKFAGLIEPEGGDVDITQHAVLVAVGRGIQSADNLPMVEELAKALGGVVCSSRPIVDNKWLPKTRQVGKSGLKVKPKVYLMLGISGAPEHIEGMKDSELVIAVNTDASAPIFAHAHYGTTADLFELVPALTAKLK